MQQRAQARDAAMAAAQREREAELARRALERRLLLRERAETVEAARRRGAYEQLEALRGIEEETARVRSIKAQRQALQARAAWQAGGWDRASEVEGLGASLWCDCAACRG